MEIDHDEQCWCDSGKKYKECHLDRESESPIQSWEVFLEKKKAFGAKVCTVPFDMRIDCNGDIIRAHTIPKSISLKKIARNGHVYAFVPTSNSQIKKHDNGIFQVQLVGINNASTFTGFCSVHDTKLFSPLENNNFIASQEQCFLLSYRAYAREIYLKKAMKKYLEYYKQVIDRGQPIQNQLAVQTVLNDYEIGLETSLEKDITNCRRCFETLLLCEDFSIVQAYVVVFCGIPPVMCSGMFVPEQDFDGNNLQDLSDLSKALKIISVTSFYSGEYGYFVLTWLTHDDTVCIPFVKSLASISDRELPSVLLVLMFEFIENVHISPDWWDCLSESFKTAFEMRMTGSPEWSHSGCLKLDKWLPADSWPIISKREWIGIKPVS